MSAPRTKHMEDFEVLQVLGQGSFGDVVKVKDLETGTEYAMKAMQKSLITRLGKQKYVMEERNILMACDHPNIVHLYYTFRSEACLHYVIELCPNGELLSYIRKYKCLSVECARFYMAEMVNALEHLHQRSIVHRDIKPENILLSADMHAKLSDFGTAKNLAKEAQEGKPRTNSFVGTAEYVPPEVLNLPSVQPPEHANEPLVSTSADLWSLGVVLYQMLTGKHAFRGKSEMLTFERVKSRDIHYPKNMCPEGKDLIEKLLQMDPNARLGANGNFAALKSHPFFAGIDFASLATTTPPPMSGPAEEPIWDEEPAEKETPAPVSAAPVVSVASVPSKAPSPDQQIDAEATQKYAAFLKPGEDVQMKRFVMRKVLLRDKHEVLLLTTAPRILLLSEDGKDQKVVRDIPWTLSLSFGLKDSTKFFIESAGEKLKFKDIAHSPQKLISALETVMKKHRAEAVPQSQ